MFDQPKYIDLALPRSWNQCTTEQLESIAACIMKHTAQADRYHPYDWIDVKTELFFLLSGTQIIRTEASENDSEGTIIVCKQDKDTFNIRPWQVQSWIESQLKWLDDEKQTLLLFPYKTLLFTRRWQWRWPFRKKEHHAPSELLQDFTWRQYRHLQDYMDLFVKQNNRLVRILQSAHDIKQVADIEKAMTDTRNEFLKILFRCEDHPRLVERINDIQWQVVLLWWAGFMHYLKEHYPRCFKSASDDKKKPKKQPNPLELYTSIIATMQKYIGIDEEKVNDQTFHIILEQLERIAKENEEIEKMNKKHKHK